MSGHHSDTAIGSLIVAMGLCVVAAGAAVWLWQASNWLRYGVWPTCPLSQAWAVLNNGRPLPSAEWGGVQQMLSWVFEQSTALALFCLGGLIAFVGGMINEYR